jgi:antitoxin component YwqK of YwqJK toxin-antitoxin module
MKAYEAHISYRSAYIITFKTTGLVPVATTVVDADFALYKPSSRKIIIKKVYDVENKKQLIKKDVMYQFLETGISENRVGVEVYKTLKAAKQYLTYLRMSNGWKRKYNDDGSLKRKTLYTGLCKCSDIDMEIFDKEISYFSNHVIERNGLRNYTCIRNLKNEILLKVTGIAYFKENTTQIESIHNYKNKRMNGFEKHFDKHGVLTELFYYKNDKWNGKSFDYADGFQFFQYDSLIFTKISSIFHHVSYLINKKGKIHVV